MRPSLARNIRHVFFDFTRKHFGWPHSPPPYDAKANFIAGKGREHDLGVFIETGTFRGEMLQQQLPNFKKLISVELSQELYEAACNRFKESPQVRLVQGDSGVKLAEVVKDLNEPALFWLDAHYSIGITAGRGINAPIFKELSCLAGRRQYRDAILIDDARLFGWDFGYPSLKMVKKYVSEHWPNHQFQIESDVICIIPAGKNLAASNPNGASIRAKPTESL